MSLTTDDVDRFLADGVVLIPGAVDAITAGACRDELWAATGYDRYDQRTWAETLVRIEALSTPPFRAAANAPLLLAAFDQLVGPGRWLPRRGLGTFPLRFPGPGDARDAGWHVEASFAGLDGRWRVNVRSRGRALLMLFLFSDVSENDAPTLLRVGSHRDVAPLLAPFGDDGLEWMEICQQATEVTAARPVIAATGSLGDVYLCHPFLVHSGQAHRGAEPRFMAQPPLEPCAPEGLDDRDPYPVARAIRSNTPLTFG